MTAHGFLVLINYRIETKGRGFLRSRSSRPVNRPIKYTQYCDTVTVIACLGNISETATDVTVDLVCVHGSAVLTYSLVESTTAGSASLGFSFRALFG